MLCDGVAVYIHACSLLYIDDGCSVIKIQFKKNSMSPNQLTRFRKWVPKWSDLLQYLSQNNVNESGIELSMKMGVLKSPTLK